MKRLVAPDLARTHVDLSESDNPDFWLRSLMDEAGRGVPLADFECPHGHLPTDLTIECACFRHDLAHAEQVEYEWRNRYGDITNLT